ncbi:hypothetical protein [Pseudobacteriovorax antillogorgiicola]|uniref:Uncharacterized protein n=1 Tax=Pseudobacteriovorax antillogorgiicola TaxID=1513793 RepID=A0A1Y6BN95_9BACT|nr:hypothetical protein [Pseudobacteriovorax antillogorgiicola]TCS54549.1 hypothetical protein EDD56_10662 [Pseudobacteriovorax antillogorgiicola]SMF18498.1 hypothetical protein SAMN06296036_106181 [Pseudobacteriovorax antillogorgiicola]
MGVNPVAQATCILTTKKNLKSEINADLIDKSEVLEQLILRSHKMIALKKFEELEALSQNILELALVSGYTSLVSDSIQLMTAARQENYTYALDTVIGMQGSHFSLKANTVDIVDAV